MMSYGYKLMSEEHGPRDLARNACRDEQAGLRRARLERGIGVIDRPDPEPGTHYLSTRLPDQFDAVLHFDETRAVEPLEPASERNGGEVPPTFPFSV